MAGVDVTKALKKEQHGKEHIGDTNNSTSSDDPDKDESEDFHEVEKRSSKINTPHLATKKLSRGRYVHVTYVLGVTLTVIVAVLYSEIIASASEDDSSGMADKIKSHIKAWRTSYPNQINETWYTIAGQMLEFVSIGHMSPLVFVMAYKEAHKTTKILASEISRAALQLKNGIDECGDTDVAKISGSDKRIKPGFLLNDCVPHVEQCRKMIMYNVEELDAIAAKDLHSLLDPDYPIIHDVVYIFTVKVHNSEGNVYLEVKNTLRNHWSPKIEDDRLYPLLSRLVNNIKIIPEPMFEY